MDMKQLIKRVLDVDFDFEIKEVPSDGVLVRYNGSSAEVGGSTKPALARAYMLLAKAVAEAARATGVARI